MRSYWKYSKITICRYEKEYWKLSGYERIIRKDHQNCLFDDKEIACKKRWETF